MPGQRDLFLIQLEIEGLGKINGIGSGQKGVMIYLEEVKNLFDVMFDGTIIRLRTRRAERCFNARRENRVVA